MVSYSRRIEGHFKRWDVSADENVEIVRFRNRLIAAVDQSVGVFILNHSALSRKLAILVGHPQPTRSSVGMSSIQQLAQGGMFGSRFNETATFNALHSASKIEDVIFTLQCLFWLLDEHNCPNVNRLVNAVRGAIDASPGISIRLTQRGNRVTLHPQGARLLDEGIVDETMAWLAPHPTVAKHFENALLVYLRKAPYEYRNILDELRSGLEKLLRRLFNNRKSLEKQEKLLGAWMKKKKVHVHIRNLYQQLLARFIGYQNDAVKHGDGWQVSEPEVEYMIYLTGTFMRFLLQLDKGKEAGR